MTKEKKEGAPIFSFTKLKLALFKTLNTYFKKTLRIKKINLSDTTSLVKKNNYSCEDLKIFKANFLRIGKKN